MKMIIDELVTLLGLEIAPGTLAKLQSFEGMVSSLAKTVGYVSGGLLTAATGIGYFAERMNQTTAGLAKLTDVTGLNAEELQQAGLAAQMAGGSYEGMISAITQFSARSPNAALGILDTDMIRFGAGYDKVTGKLLHGKDLMIDLASGFSRLSTSAEKFQWAQRLGLTDQLPFLNKGPEYVREMYERIEKLPIISPKQLAAAREFQIQIDMLRLNFQRLGQIAASVAEPAMEAIVGDLEKLIANNQELIQSGLTYFFEGVMEAAQWAGNFIGRIAHVMLDVRDSLIRTFPSLGKLIEHFKEFNAIAPILEAAIIGIGIALLGMSIKAALAAAPFLLLAAAIMAVVKAYEKIQVNRELFETVAQEATPGTDILKSMREQKAAESPWNHWLYSEGNLWDKMKEMVHPFAPATNMNQTTANHNSQITINQHINGDNARQIGREVTRQVTDALTQTYPGLLAPVVN